MTDYGFYRDVFLGSRIPEESFPELIERASDKLEHYRRIYRFGKTGPQTEGLALCAMAERMYMRQRRREGISYASLGNVSVRYDHKDREDEDLLGAALVYLDICRAIG